MTAQRLKGCDLADNFNDGILSPVAPGIRISTGIQVGEVFVRLAVFDPAGSSEVPPAKCSLVLPGGTMTLLSSPMSNPIHAGAVVTHRAVQSDAGSVEVVGGACDAGFVNDRSVDVLHGVERAWVAAANESLRVGGWGASSGAMVASQMNHYGRRGRPG